MTNTNKSEEKQLATIDPQRLMRTANDVAHVCGEIVKKTAIQIKGRRYIRVDVSVLLDLDAQQLYNELTQVQTHFPAFASKTTEAGEKAKEGFVRGFSSSGRSAQFARGRTIV